MRHMVLIWILWLVAFGTAYAQAPVDQIAASEAALRQGQFNILVATVAGFLTLLVTRYFDQRKDDRRRGDEQAAKERQRQWDLQEAERKRQWDLEDRRMAREAADLKLSQQTDELKRIAQLEAELTRARAAQVEAELKAAALKQTEALKASEDKLLTRIDQNTQISKEAFKEANDVNRKLLAISTAIDGVRPRGARRATDEVAADLAHIQHTVDETHRVITDDAKPVMDETLERVRQIETATTDGDGHAKHG
jgi:hypothetical protein